MYPFTEIPFTEPVRDRGEELRRRRRLEEVRQVREALEAASRRRSR